MSTVAGQIRKYAQYLFSHQESLAHKFHKSKTYQLCMKQEEGADVFKEFVNKKWRVSRKNIQSVGEKQFFFISEKEIERFVEHSFHISGMYSIEYYIETGQEEKVEKEFQRQWYPIFKEYMMSWKKENKDLLAATKFYAEYNKTYKFDEYDSLDAFESEHNMKSDAMKSKPPVKLASKSLSNPESAANDKAPEKYHEDLNDFFKKVFELNDLAKLLQNYPKQ